MKRFLSYTEIEPQVKYWLVAKSNSESILIK